MGSIKPEPPSPGSIWTNKEGELFMVLLYPPRVLVNQVTRQSDLDEVVIRFIRYHAYMDAVGSSQTAQFLPLSQFLYEFSPLGQMSYVKEINPPIDLSQYASNSHSKKVRVTLRDGNTWEGWVKMSGLRAYPYTVSGSFYTVDGRFTWRESPLDILKVELLVSDVVSREQCLRKIEELEEELRHYKECYEHSRPSSIDGANVGEVLIDGSILLKKENGIALLAAPDFTEIEASWDNRLKVYASITDHGFRGEEWFIPTAAQLDLAHVAAPEHLSPNKCYWSSESANDGEALMCTGGPQDKRATLRVRLFRCLTY